jgi:hypothetical protein
VTPQEQELLKSLTQKINQTQLQEKDPDAENLLGRELGVNPDALYILAQTVLVQNIALDQAKAQVAQLQQQLQQAQQSRPQPAHATSFLGRLLGEKDEPTPPPSFSQQPARGPQEPPYQPVPQYSQPQYAPPPAQYAPAAPQYAQPQYVPVQSGQPSFLRGAMQTAAGVAAGALAFEGVESIVHSFGHGGYGPGMMGTGMGLGGGYERPVEETVINNYYDEPGNRGFERERPEGEHHFHETEDRGGAQFSDASYNSAGDDRSDFDDNTSAFDDGVQDDSGLGSDDGGGFDNSSSGDLV